MEWRDLLERPYTGCSLPPCVELAACLYQGYPLCLDCADLVLERLNVSPAFRRLLPMLSDR